MTTTEQRIKAGDRFLWESGINNFGTVYVKVTRVSSTGQFVVARCWRAGSDRPWVRRFDLPLWPSVRRHDWVFGDSATPGWSEWA